MGWYNYLLRLGQFFLETKSPLHFHTPKHIAAFYVYTEGKHAPHSTYIQTTTNYSALHLVSQNVRERERRMLIFLEYAMSCFTCNSCILLPLKELLHQSTYWCINPNDKSSKSNPKY